MILPARLSVRNVMSEQTTNLSTERMREANCPLTSEDVAYWYLRLNGFLTLENFLVHGDRRGEERTEIDVLGVRFQHRREHLANPMEDDSWITKAGSTIVVFCDAKRGARDFNDSWTRRDRRVMESFLALVGIVPQTHWHKIAQDLYRTGRSSPRKGLLLTTLLVHHDPDSIAHIRWPDAPRVQLGDALRFVHERFEIYRNIKSAHTQWDASGHRLWDLYEEHRDNPDQFVWAVLSEIGCEGIDSAQASTPLASRGANNRNRSRKMTSAIHRQRIKPPPPNKSREPRILHLTLHRKWFDAIALGRKKTEYREDTAYWRARLLDRSYDEVHFRNGYATRAPFMRVRCLGIRKERGRFAIRLGEVLQTRDYAPE